MKDFKTLCGFYEILKYRAIQSNFCPCKGDLRITVSLDDPVCFSKR
jgi:fructose-1-phosphate kinase PfkB-like protein